MCSDRENVRSIGDRRNFDFKAAVKYRYQRHDEFPCHGCSCAFGEEHTLQVNELLHRNFESSIRKGNGRDTDSKPSAMPIVRVFNFILVTVDPLIMTVFVPEIQFMTFSVSPWKEP